MKRLQFLLSDMIKFHMVKEGYEVVTAFDGREALEVKIPPLIIYFF